MIKNNVNKQRKNEKKREAKKKNNEHIAIPLHTLNFWRYFCSIDRLFRDQQRQQRLAHRRGHKAHAWTCARQRISLFSQVSFFLFCNDKLLFKNVSRTHLAIFFIRLDFFFFFCRAPHPFWIKTVAGTLGNTNAFSNGLTRNGVNTTIHTTTFFVQYDAPQNLFYQCGDHSTMSGSIHISDQGLLCVMLAFFLVSCSFVCLFICLFYFLPCVFFFLFVFFCFSFL